MIPPQNVMPARVTLAWVHPGCCATPQLLHQIQTTYLRGVSLYPSRNLPRACTQEKKCWNYRPWKLYLHHRCSADSVLNKKKINNNENEYDDDDDVNNDDENDEDDDDDDDENDDDDDDDDHVNNDD